MTGEFYLRGGETGFTLTAVVTLQCDGLDKSLLWMDLLELREHQADAFHKVCILVQLLFDPKSKYLQTHHGIRKHIRIRCAGVNVPLYPCPFSLKRFRIPYFTFSLVIILTL